MEKVVKLKFLLSFFFILLFSINQLNAQTNPLQKKITLSVKNEKVENTLNKMGELGNYSFSYNSDIVPLDSQVTINAVNKETVKILNSMLGMDYYYKTTGHYIIILKKNINKTNGSSNAEKICYTITGTIIDSRTGEKITTATVYNLNKIETALTDAAGIFSIKVVPETDYISLGISKVNYYDTIIYIKPTDKNNIELKLSPKPENINKLTPKTIQTISTKEINDDLLVNTFVSNEMLVNSMNLSDYNIKKFQLSLLPFAGSNHKLSGSITNKMSINILSGYSNGVDGVEVGGMLNINKKDVKGLQVAGFGNITGRNVKGVQLGGFFNTTMGKVNGVQIAGFLNTVFDSLNGAQVAGSVNMQKGNLNGVQLSGFGNITTKNVEKLQLTGYVNLAGGNCNGMQIAGFANLCKGDNNGLQISSYVNFARGNNRILQLSGFVNIATKESKGGQIAAFLNYAKTVKGYQIGIINVADTVSGLSIGLFNIVRKGYHCINLSFDEMLFSNISYYMGTHKFYTIFGASITPFNATKSWGATFGFGTLLRYDKRFSINIDLTTTQINRDMKWEDTTSSKYKFAVGLNYRLSKHWFVSAGPSLNLFATDKENIETRNYITDVSPHNFYYSTSGETNYQAWVGYFVGVKFKL